MPLPGCKPALQLCWHGLPASPAADRAGVKQGSRPHCGDAVVVQLYALTCQPLANRLPTAVRHVLLAWCGSVGTQGPKVNTHGMPPPYVADAWCGRRRHWKDVPVRLGQRERESYAQVGKESVWQTQRNALIKGWLWTPQGRGCWVEVLQLHAALRCVTLACQRRPPASSLPICCCSSMCPRTSGA